MRQNKLFPDVQSQSIRRSRLSGASTAVIEQMESRQLLSSVVVNSISDTATGNGVVTLRDAITTADSSTSPTTITFDPSVFAAAQTIVLDGSQLELSNTAEPTTITGPSAGVTVSGNSASRVFLIDSDVTVNIQGVNVIDGLTTNATTNNGDSLTGGGILSLGTLAYTGGTISGNTAGYGGGGIGNAGTLTVTNATITDNSSDGHGGGVENFGAVSGDAVATLTNVTLSDNSSTTTASYGGGGAIASDTNGASGTTTLNLNNVTISDNSSQTTAGGIYLDTSNTGSTFTDVTVTGNTADGAGGGIANGGSLVVTGGTITDNSSGAGGGGIFNIGHLTVTNSSITSNTGGTGTTAGVSGGGLQNNGGSGDAIATLTDDTFSGNSAPLGGGGGIASDIVGNTSGTTTVNLDNVTVANNTAGVGGGGIYLDASNSGSTLIGVTISGNSTPGDGGGIYDAAGSGASIGNTIVAGNSVTGSSSAGPDVDGAVTSLGYNLVGEIDGSSGWIGTGVSGTIASPLNADLGSLTNNGGPTETLLPEAGSPVIGAGSVALIPTGITTDQRGDPRTVNGGVDIGAVEVGGSSAVAVTSTALSLSAHTIIAGGPVTFTATVTPATTGGPTPTGSIEFVATSTLGAVATQTVSLGSGGSVTLQLPTVNFPNDPGNWTIVANYSGDSSNAASASAGSSLIILVASPAVPTITRATVPTTAIAGQKFVAKVPVELTNTGARLSGNFKVVLYADQASSGLDGNQVQLSSEVRHTTVKTGHALPFLLSTKTLPASLAAGTYHLDAEITDPDGNVNLVTTSQTVAVAAPFVALPVTIGSVSPTSLSTGKTGTISVTIPNYGNVPTTGTLTITLSASLDGVSPVGGLTLATLTEKNVVIKTGKNKAFKLHFKVPSTLATGSYFPYVSVMLNGISATSLGISRFTVG